MKMSPQSVLAKSFHSGSPVLPVAVLLTSIFILPPALKNYLAASADAKVTVLTNEMLLAPAPRPPVKLLVPVQPVNCVPLATALPRLLKQLVTSVFNADNIDTVLPVTGAVLAVIAVP